MNVLPPLVLSPLHPDTTLPNRMATTLIYTAGALVEKQLPDAHRLVRLGTLVSNDVLSALFRLKLVRRIAADSFVTSRFLLLQLWANKRLVLPLVATILLFRSRRAAVVYERSTQPLPADSPKTERIAHRSAAQSPATKASTEAKEEEKAGKEQQVDKALSPEASTSTTEDKPLFQWPSRKQEEKKPLTAASAAITAATAALASSTTTPTTPQKIDSAPLVARQLDFGSPQPTSKSGRASSADSQQYSTPMSLNAAPQTPTTAPGAPIDPINAELSEMRKSLRSELERVKSDVATRRQKAKSSRAAKAKAMASELDQWEARVAKDAALRSQLREQLQEIKSNRNV